MLALACVLEVPIKELGPIDNGWGERVGMAFAISVSILVVAASSQIVRVLGNPLPELGDTPVGGCRHEVERGASASAVGRSLVAEAFLFLVVQKG